MSGRIGQPKSRWASEKEAMTPEFFDIWTEMNQISVDYDLFDFTEFNSQRYPW